MNKRAETIELLEENTREKLHDLAFGNHFLYMTSKAQATKEKNRWIGLHPNEKLWCIKEHCRQSKKATHIIEENICETQN